MMRRGDDAVETKPEETTTTGSKVEEVSFHEMASRSHTPCVKPPIVPRVVTCEKPKSIMKTISRGASSKSRRVSFTEPDEDFSEPTLRFGRPKQPRDDTATGGEPDVAPSKDTLSDPSDVQEQQTEQSVGETTMTYKPPEDSLPKLSQGSLITASCHSTPLAVGDNDDKKEASSEVCAPDKSPKKTPPGGLSEMAYRGEDLSSLPDVSISDETPTPSSTFLLQCRSVSSESVVPPFTASCSQRVGATPIPPEVHSSHLLPPDDHPLPPFTEQILSNWEGGAPVVPLSPHDAWLDDTTEAVVQPLRAQNSVDALSFEGGVDPADLVFDDTPTSEEKRNEGDCDLTGTESPPGQRVIDFSGQTHSNLVPVDDVLHVVAPHAFPESSPSNTADNGEEMKVDGQGRYRAVKSGNDLSMPLRSGLCRISDERESEVSCTHFLAPQVRQRIHLNDCDAVSERPTLTTTLGARSGVQATLPGAQIIKKNQGPPLHCEYSPTVNCAKPFVSLGGVQAQTHSPRRQATPVVVEYISNSSSSRREAFCDDIHRYNSRSRSRDDVHPLQHQHRTVRELFPGTLFAQFPGEPIDVAPRVSIKRTEMVVSKPLKTKKKKHGDSAPLVAADLTSIPGSNRNGQSNHQAKTPSVMSLWEEACTEAEEFEEVGLYNAHLTPAMDLTPLNAVDAWTAEQHQERRQLSNKKAARIFTTLDGSGGRGSGGADSLQKRRDADTKREKEEEQRRARRFEKLHLTLLQLACKGGEPASPSKDHMTNCGGHFSLDSGRGFSPVVADDLVRVRRKITLLPPPSPVTAEGLIHTPERVASLERSDELPSARPPALFPPARSSSVLSPTRCGGGRSHRVSGDSFGGTPERRATDRLAIKTFVSDIAVIVRALREREIAR